MTERRSVHIGVYADVDLNIIDGSAIWLISVCSVLSRIEDVIVHLVLKAPVDRRVLLQELQNLENVHLVEPERRRTPASASEAMRSLGTAQPLDVVVVRGRLAAIEMLREPSFSGKVWAYLTDVPQTLDNLESEEGHELFTIIDQSARVLCQTESLRAWFVSLAPHADQKMLLLPPMVAPEAFRHHSRQWGQDGLRLFYAGKFAPDWGVLESIAEVEKLSQLGVSLSLVVAGDKIHDPPDLPAFADSIRNALASSSVDWRGGLERRQVFELLEEVDLALSMRSKELNTSREISTKLLEYSAAGVPVVANRTLAHLELFGSDYPLLVDSFDELAETLHRLSLDPTTLEWMSQRVREVAKPYSYDAGAERLRNYMKVAPQAETHTMKDRRIVIAGHDLKFISDLADSWTTNGAEVVIDPWAGHGAGQAWPAETPAEAPDLILCEWMLGNAAYYSRNRPKPTPLIVRFHRMELETKWPAEVRMEAVDAVVFVSDHIQKEAIRRFGFDQSKAVVIPNAVDTAAFNRPKLPGSAFTLAMVGMLPSLKRLDRALDLLVLLRQQDDRYRLALRGPLPGDVSWVWNNPLERAYFEQMFDRIEKEPLLGEAVSFEPPGPDMGSWLMQAGYILSPSDIESFHMALVEGMASGAVPVVWRRDGADEIVSPSWVHSTTSEAAEWIHANSSSRADLGERAAMEARERYSVAVIRPLWHRLFEQAFRRRDSLLPFEDLAPGTKEWSQASSEELADAVENIVKMSPYRYNDDPPTQYDFEVAGRLLKGQFSPSRLFEPVAGNLPPDWLENPLQNRSWDFHRHSLEWLESLIRVAASGSDEALDGLSRTVESWIAKCSIPPGPTPYAWNDHAVAIRARLLVFLISTLGKTGRLDDEFAEIVLRSLLQHGSFLADDRFYVGNSNHALEMDASLLVLAAALGNLPQAGSWRMVASGRLSQWLKANFSGSGTHLEQSPGYHLFVSIRLLSIVSYLRENGLPVPEDLQKAAEKGVAIWPFFRRPDGSTPMIGDTPEFPRPVDWQRVVQRLTNRLPRSVAPETFLNPRPSEDSFFIDAEAGYAVFADRKPSALNGGWSDDLGFHLVVKCSAFDSPHRHNDIGSFVLWALGGDWLVDSGFFSMEASTPERRYMRSARAHNVVIVDDEDFELGPNSIIDRGRGPDGDFVSVEHILSSTVHTRTVTVTPTDLTLVVNDRITSNHGKPHTANQLFHVHPRLSVEVMDDRHIELRDDEGHILEITQENPVVLSRFSGDHDGRPTAWYSPEYMERIPSHLLSFAAPDPRRELVFTTRIRFIA